MTDKIPDSLYEIHRSIGRVEGKLDALIATVTVSNDNHVKNDDEMDGRLRNIEHKQYWFGGAAAMLGAFASYFLNSFKA